MTPLFGVVFAALIPGAGAAQPVLTEEVRTQALVVLDKYITVLYGRDQMDRAVAGRLTAAMIESGRSYEEIRDLYEQTKRISPSISDQANATLAAGTAISGKLPADLFTLFIEVFTGTPFPNYENSTELAAAAAISRKSSQDVNELAFSVWDWGRTDLSHREEAILAAGAARSGRAPKLVKNYYDSLPQSKTSVVRAHLAAGSAMTGLSLSEHVALHDTVCTITEIKLVDESCALMANAYLILITRADRFPDFSRQLGNPVRPAKTGEGRRAEEVFDLNWFGL